MAKKRQPDLPKPRVVRQNADGSVRLDKIEPANWWTGMANPTVMLTIYGRNVALTRPRLESRGIGIESVRLTDSVNHMFVDIRISPDAKPGKYVIELTRDGETVATADFALEERRRGSAQREGVTRADVVYLAMPDRFASTPGCGTDADMAEKFNRKLPHGRHGGNIDGLRRHADYLHRLGVSALWLTPVQTNDMERDSFHGYAATDYYGIDPRLGTLEDYRRLSASLSQWGVKLIMDIVLNHCGTRHPWLSDSPGTGWFSEWDWKPELTNYRPGVVTDMHASEYDRRRTICGWFDKAMADLNMANPLVETYMAEMAIWWIETAGLQGLRVDTFPYSDGEGVRRWAERVKREYPNLLIVGETWVGEAAKLAPWTKSGLTRAMDFPLQEAVTLAFNEDFGWGRGANRLYDAISNDHIYAHPEDLMTFADNHDTGRIFTRLGGDIRSLWLAMTFLLTTRGMPQIYYGTEMLMEGESTPDDADIRRDMPGGWDSDKEDWFVMSEEGTAPQKNGTPGRAEQRKATFKYISSLLKFRRGSEALKNGSLTHFMPTANVYTYFRRAETGNGSETVMVVLNMEKKRMTLRMEQFAELAGETLNGTDIISGRKHKGANSLTLKARTADVIRLDTQGI